MSNCQKGHKETVHTWWLQLSRLFVCFYSFTFAFLYHLTGFPFQCDRRHMPHIPSLGYSHCEVIRFRPLVFYPDKTIQVQITVNHIDTSDKTYVHDAAVSWIEDVTYEQFTACVMAAGFNERKSRANVSIDWIAYQGAPVGGVTGEVRMSQWWTGTTCKTVNFPSVSIFFVLVYQSFVWLPEFPKISWICKFCISCTCYS